MKIDRPIYETSWEIVTAENISYKAMIEAAPIAKIVTDKTLSALQSRYFRKMPAASPLLASYSRRAKNTGDSQYDAEFEQHVGHLACGLIKKNLIAERDFVDVKLNCAVYRQGELTEVRVTELTDSPSRPFQLNFQPSYPIPALLQHWNVPEPLSSRAANGQQ